MEENQNGTWRSWEQLWRKLKEEEINRGRGENDSLFIDITNLDPHIIGRARQLAGQDDAPFNFSGTEAGDFRDAYIEITPEQRTAMERFYIDPNQTAPSAGHRFLLNEVSPALDREPERPQGVFSHIRENPVQFATSTAASFATYAGTKAVIGCLLTTTGLTSVAAATVAAGVVTSGLIGIGKTWIDERKQAAERVEQMRGTGSYSPDQLAAAAKIDYSRVFKEGIKKSAKSGLLAGLTGGLLGGLLDVFDPTDITEHCADATAPPAGDTSPDSIYGPFPDEIDVIDECQPEAPCDFTAIDAQTAQIEQVMAMLCPDEVSMDGQLTDVEQARLLERYGLEIDVNDQGQLVASTEQLESFYTTNVDCIQSDFVDLAECDPALAQKLAHAGIDLDCFADGVAGPQTAEAFRITGEHLGLDMELSHPCDGVTYDWGRTSEVLDALGDHVGTPAQDFDPECCDVEPEVTEPVEPCVDDVYVTVTDSNVYDLVTQDPDVYAEVEDPNVYDLVTQDPDVYAEVEDPNVYDLVAHPEADGYALTTEVDGILYGSQMEAAYVTTTTEEACVATVVETPSTSVISASCVQHTGTWVELVTSTDAEHVR